MFNRVMLTGGTGFLGAAVAAALPGAQVLGSRQLDLRRGEAVAAFVQDHRPEVVVHMAARVGGIRANMAQPADFLLDNVRMDANLLAALCVHKPKHLLVILSTCMYPDALPAQHYPMAESMLDAGPPPPTNASYALAKRALWQAAQALHAQYNVPFTCLVPANMYGPHDHFNGEHAHFLATALSRTGTAAAQQAPRVEFFGSGRAVRQYVYVRDVAWLIRWCVEHGPLNQTLNVAPQQSHSIAELAQQAAVACGYTGHIAFSGVGPDGQLCKDASSARLRKVVPEWSQIETPLAVGLQQTVAWHRAQA